MKSDLVAFKEKHDLLCMNYTVNRLLVFVEDNADVYKLNNFKNEWSKITIISPVPLTISLENCIVKPTKKVNKKEHPIDPAVYRGLNTGFKEYEYYITSLVFIK